jgi:hypothetical protein
LIQRLVNPAATPSLKKPKGTFATITKAVPYTFYKVKTDKKGSKVSLSHYKGENEVEFAVPQYVSSDNASSNRSLHFGRSNRSHTPTNHKSEPRFVPLSIRLATEESEKMNLRSPKKIISNAML